MTERREDLQIPSPQPETHIESGAVSRLTGVLDSAKARGVVLVTGAGSYTRSGARAAIEPQLSGYAVEVVDGFSPNPTVVEVEAGLDAVRRAASHGPYACHCGGGAQHCIALSEAPVVVAVVRRAEVRHGTQAGASGYEGGEEPRPHPAAPHRPHELQRSDALRTCGTGGACRARRLHNAKPAAASGCNTLAK